MNLKASLVYIGSAKTSGLHETLYQKWGIMGRAPFSDFLNQKHFNKKTSDSSAHYTWDVLNGQVLA